MQAMDTASKLEASLVAANQQASQDMNDATNPVSIGKENWLRVKKRLRSELGEDVFSSWFASVEMEVSTDSLVKLSVPTRFLKSWIHSHYGDLLIGLWRDDVKSVRRIDLIVRGAVRPKPKPVPPKPQAATARPIGGGLDGRHNVILRAEDEKLGGSPLDQRLSFSSFVTGSSNELAFAAARKVAEARRGDAAVFNPLFVHAQVGLGKTHLLQAVANASRASDPSRRVLYLTAERFMFRFVQALKNQTAIQFKEQIQAIDLLLIDDLQFLQGKSIQQEFCHTLNSLIDGARQVVVAADRPPVELESLDERVRSRLAGGLVAEILPLEKQMRRKILQERFATATRNDPTVQIPGIVLDHVAAIVSSNGRDLDGAFNRLLAYNQLTGTPISIEMADQALKDLIRNKEPKRVRIEDIQRVVSKHYNVSRTDLLSSRRTRTIVRPRQVAMFLAKTMTPRSLPEIGRRFGGRDHTTVLHAVRKIQELSSNDMTLKQEIELLRRQVAE